MEYEGRPNTKYPLIIKIDQRVYHLGGAFSIRGQGLYSVKPLKKSNDIPTLLTRAIYFGICFFRFGYFFLDFCFPASLLFSFSAFCFSAFPCFFAFIYSSLLLCLSTFLLLCFFASLLLCLSAFLLFLLFCFSSFFASLFSLLLCLSAFLLLCLSLFFLVSHTADNP